jgi:transposase
MGEQKSAYRTYPEEFKLEALEMLKNSGKSSRQIERDLGITAGMLLKWRDRYQVIAKGEAQPHLEPSDFEAAKREIKRLQRRLAEVEEDRAILKKTISIFSRKIE